MNLKMYSIKFSQKSLFIILVISFTCVYSQSLNFDFKNYKGVWSDGDKIYLDIYNVLPEELFIGYYSNTCSRVLVAKQSINKDVIELFFEASNCDKNQFCNLPQISDWV